MSRPHQHRSAGFTISELIIGMSLSMIVMAGVLTSYVFVAKSYARTIAFGGTNQPTLTAQGRRMLAYLAQDVPMASTVGGNSTSTNPSASDFTLTVPRSDGGSKTIRYYYNSARVSGVPVTAAVTGPNATGTYNVTVPADSLVRIDCNANTFLTLHGNIILNTCVFTFYDDSGNPYTAATLSATNPTTYLIGIKQLSLVLNAQSGSSTNGTLSPVYKVASPRFVFRNKSLLP